MQRRTFLASLVAGLVGLFTFRKAVAAPAPAPKPVAPTMPEFYSGTWNVDYLELPPYRKVTESRRIDAIRSVDGSHIVELRPVPNSERTSIYYKSIFVMFDDIRKHVAETGESILCADDPLERMCGYTNEPGTLRWVISPLDLKTSLNACEPKNTVKAALIREYIKTREGRVKLAQTLSAGPLSGITNYVKPGVYC